MRGVIILRRWKNPPQDSTQKTLKEEIPRAKALGTTEGKRGDSSQKTFGMTEGKRGDPSG
jgi:hypothetical protein